MSDAGVEEVDLDELDDGDDGNRLVGSTSRAVLEYVAKAIVDDPEAVVVEVDEGRGTVSLRLHVSPSDMGRVIGRRGRVAQGSGTTTNEVNQLLKQFKDMQKMMRMFGKGGGGKGRPRVPSFG